ncbi:signal peptidase II [Hydrogenobacter hydrogenophilus]|uniref:Lipoprotein signal peptidase n=1 Tax=Hydrogenobacter hydrogenophilus TaxID=35835 RepID=A0A285NUU3_9AQUI|nr:signal peptidase II [Hydrogenobacter hydrogenophilus]SNZ13262.1 signal peptidase II Aspartic peptidase. MEROPS family A08 [Hydrogenobacter hydrogenophilus]
MEKHLRKSLVAYFITFFFILASDLVTKKLAEHYLYNREVSLLPFLHLVLVYNKGVAFGILSNAPDIIRLPLVLLSPLVALVLTFLYAIKRKDTTTALLMGMVAGGAIGNFHDRLFLGYVRDFIYISYGKFSWPAFNLADMGISVAILLLLTLSFSPSNSHCKN